MVRKYSYEFKKFIVTVLESGIMSACELSRRLKIHKGVICRLYNKYKSLGDEGIKYTYTRKKYTIEFKIKVLKYKLENNLSYEQTALHFNTPSSTVIYDWNKFCSKFIGDNMSDKNIPNSKKSNHSKSIDIKINKSEYSEEVRQLKERISELEKELYYKSAENAYLKKLEALMQEKQEKRQK